VRGVYKRTSRRSEKEQEEKCANQLQLKLTTYAGKQEEKPEPFQPALQTNRKNTKQGIGIKWVEVLQQKAM